MNAGSSSGGAQAPVPLLDLRIGNKYKIGRKIGSGSFGDIYLGVFGIFGARFRGLRLTD